MAKPIEGLLDRLNKSWGPPGIEGSVEEIFHITTLIKDYLNQIVEYEEKVYFTNVPEEYENVVESLKNLIGSQASKLADIPSQLDEVVSLIHAEHEGTIEKPKIIDHTITFELPDGWEKQMNRELKRVSRHQMRELGEGSSNGCLAMVIGVIIIGIIISLI